MRRVSIFLALSSGSRRQRAGLAQTASPVATPEANLAGTMPLELSGEPSDHVRGVHPANDDGARCARGVDRRRPGRQDRAT